MNAPPEAAAPPKPQTPDEAALEVARKMEKVSAVSRLILFGGVGAVMAVIGYRVATGSSTPGVVQSGRIAAEGRVISAVAGDGALTVTFETPGGATIVVHDLKSLRETHRIVVGGPQPPRP